MNLAKIIFVLCDDNSADLKALRKSTNEYITRRGFCGETVCFSTAEEVLRFSENRGEGDVSVYLLDVIMPDFNGIELGQRIRERDKSSSVIYISSSREYSLDAFSVRAFSYLIKPYAQEKLFSELDECLSRMEIGPQMFSVKTADNTVTLALSEIIAVEYFDHRLNFHMKSGEKIESAYRRQSFDIQAEELLETGTFLKTSASYLVNSQNIQGLKSNEFIMCNGSKYKITRKYAAARQQYINSEMSNK